MPMIAALTPRPLQESGNFQCTGAEAAGAVIGRDFVRLTHGRDCYHPETRTIYLSEATYHGTDAGAVYRALHEAGHARQHAERPVWFALRNIWVFRLWIEWDAWRRAATWMRAMGLDAEAARAVRDEGMKSYARF